MNTSLNKKEACQILRFWHQVEFFIPYDLQQQVLEAQDAKWAVKSWSLDALSQATPALWTPPLPYGRQLTGFDVYFGVFDKSLLAQVTTQTLHASLSVDDDYEQEERVDLKGLTCIAKIGVNSAGEPLLDDVAVSTAPWALGRLQAHDGNLEALDFDVFQRGIEGLKLRLRQFRVERKPVGSACASPQQYDDGAVANPGVLTGEDLLALLCIFQEWTAFYADGDNTTAIVIRAKSVELSAKKQGLAVKPDAVLGCGSADKGDEGLLAEDDVPESAIEIGILNSFFAVDIARVITALEQGRSSSALAAYLTPLCAEKRIDIYSTQGRELVFKGLSPARQPAAHWPDKPAHAMSLMQQFAINSLFEQLESGGVFSVNGPPGTGKTTLLRDVFAELITRRARVMASFTSSRDAFSGVMSLEFEGESPCYVNRLREDLTGFEMLVASSNNTAVENLSRDLPKARALGRQGDTPWRDGQGHPKVGYLQEVAHNIAARTAKGDYVGLSVDEAPWGLIACALGKKRNRSDFAYRLTADARKTVPPIPGFDPELHQSLWTWREQYQGASFTVARDVFIAADQAVKQRINLLERYAVLAVQLNGQTLESYCASCTKQLVLSKQRQKTANTALLAIKQESELCRDQLDSLRQEAELIEHDRPVWWLRWLLRKRNQHVQACLVEHRQQQRLWLIRQREARTQFDDAEHQKQHAITDYLNAEQDLAARQQEWYSLQNEWQSLTAQLPQMDAGQSGAALEDPQAQIDGLWHDEATNKLRSELFIAALGLHQAWLAEVIQKGGGFGGNVMAISHLLSGKNLLQPQHALDVWQSLFMIVPVVSSTFASIASQFRDLGPNSLGWLFIDEAGQAVPQAAVGALWRAKRAVVVGDPRQIEPVFTVPIKLIDALAQASGLPDKRQVSPSYTSVQSLSDQANIFGAWVDTLDDKQWIGCPLRVHRRCVDPMFTIANQIAYQGKMIFFDQRNPSLRLPPADSLDLGPSAWVNIKGTAQNKQVVYEQIDLVYQAVLALYQRTGTLPAIYIISPFRRVKEALIQRLSKVDAWPTNKQPSARALHEWCKARVGTVHTFQGKEESVVWMVLGCDENSRGAATWAASKPNLFNVALTRAKHRFYLIGEVELWSGLPHFSYARPDLLPRISSEVFLRRACAQEYATDLQEAAKNTQHGADHLFV